MPVVDNSKVQEFALPGLTHRTVGGKTGGVSSMEVWQQTIAAGAATPVHRHACEEVIVILSGSGTLTLQATPSPSVVGDDSPWIFAGWYTAEMPLWHIAWQVAATVVFGLEGALGSWPGWVALGVNAASWSGLVVRR